MECLTLDDWIERVWPRIKATSKNVILAKAGIQKSLKSLDSRLRGSDESVIIRGSLKLLNEFQRVDRDTVLNFFNIN
jgi:hypothetical protein